MKYLRNQEGSILVFVTLMIVLLLVMVQNTGSGLALGWTLLCLSIYGQDGAELKKRLEQQFVKTKFLGETKALALSVLALGNGARYFHM